MNKRKKQQKEEEQTKPKISKKKEIIKIREKINVAICNNMDGPEGYYP